MVGAPGVGASRAGRKRLASWVRPAWINIPNEPARGKRIVFLKPHLDFPVVESVVTHMEFEEDTRKLFAFFGLN